LGDHTIGRDGSREELGVDPVASWDWDGRERERREEIMVRVRLIPC
jgi:hypothetical protein